MILVSNPKFCLKPFDEVLDRVEKEFKGWEILAEKYHGWEYRERVRDALSTSDLKIQVHSPLNDINLASINNEIRKASIKEVKKSIEMAGMIDAELVTIHPGLYSPLSIYWEGAVDNSKDSLREVKDFASDIGVDVALENLPEMWLTMCSTVEETREFLGEVDIDFCLDIGHAYTADELEGFLELSPVNIHIHDNFGEDDIHLKLGEGDIDLRSALKSLKDYRGNFVIEGRSIEDLVESKNYLEELLRDIRAG